MVMERVKSWEDNIGGETDKKKEKSKIIHLFIIYCWGKERGTFQPSFNDALTNSPSSALSLSISSLTFPSLLSQVTTTVPQFCFQF